MFGTLIAIGGLALAAPPGGKMLEMPEGYVYGILASPDGKLVAANVGVAAGAKGDAVPGNHCLVWDAKTGEPKYSIPPEQPNVPAMIAVAFSADSKRLIGHLNQVELETKAVTKFPAGLPFPSGQVSGRMSRDRSRIASLTAENDGATIQVWDVDPATMAAKERVAVKLTKDQVAGIRNPPYAVSGDKKTLAYAFAAKRAPGAIKVVDVETGKERQSIPVPDANPVYNFALSPEGATIYAQQQALGGANAALTNVWDVKTGKAKATWKIGRLGWMQITDDGRFIVGSTGAANAEVTVFDAKTGKPHAVIPTTYAGIAGIAVAPDGSWVAIAGGTLNDPRQVGIWKVVDFKK